MEEQKDAAKETLDRGPLAQLLGSPGWRQAKAIALSFGIPRDHRHGSQDTLNPGNQAQPPIPGIQANDAGTHLVE